MGLFLLKKETRMPQITPITEGGSAKSLARFGISAHDDWQVEEGDTGSFAKIVVPAAGGSGTLRPIITGTKKHPVGAYPSYKTGLTQYWEGEAERALIHEAETYPQIVDYQMQPYRIEFTLEGARVSYTPDQARQYVDGYVELIEAKSSDRYFADPAYRRMLDRVEALVAEVGIGFRRVTMRDVYGSRRHE
jgi:hypothetical protein